MKSNTFFFKKKKSVPLNLLPNCYQTQANSCDQTLTAQNLSEADREGNRFGEDLFLSPQPSSLLFPPCLSLLFLLAASVNLMSVPNVNTH